MPYFTFLQSIYSTAVKIQDSSALALVVILSPVDDEAHEERFAFHLRVKNKCEYYQQQENIEWNLKSLNLDTPRNE